MANSVGGGVNMMNYHDPDRGFGLHSLGYFAAGYLGTSVGLSEGGAAGFFAGGVMNNFAGFAAGDIQNSYGMAQHFVGGGLASVAGKNFYSSASKAMELEKASELKKASNYFFGDALVDKAVSYGLQNIASNFAFDRSQSYFDSGAGLKIGGSFLIGAFGGLGQYGIMKGNIPKSQFLGFSKFFGYSTLAYLGEYSANNMWSTGNRYPSYRSYYRYKMGSLAIKSMFYTFLGMP
ncbi:hypothetical protein [Belliella pelovolcani]|uniref:hypothetical protein n=1 Tax=Belliella pelovolcani TaxID=529505 RepID=UPI00391A9300